MTVWLPDTAFSDGIVMFSEYSVTFKSLFSNTVSPSNAAVTDDIKSVLSLTLTLKVRGLFFAAASGKSVVITGRRFEVFVIRSLP